MLHLPDPVHPFAVHFPVVLLLCGSAGMALSLLWPHRMVLRLTAACMMLGALSAVWAQQTGMAEATAVRFVGVSVAEAVQAHKSVSDLLVVAAFISAASSVAALFARVVPGVSLMARLVGVASVVFLLWTMQASLYSGAELTHRHFFGPNAPKPFPGTEEVIRLRVE